MRALNRLTVKEIASLTPGKYADGGGLWLHKRTDGGAQWFLRYTLHGRRREMGLGPYPTVGLAECRRAAEAARAEVRENLDPILERERRKRVSFRNLNLLNEIALDAFESRKSGLKGDGLAGRWFSPLKLREKR